MNLAVMTKANKMKSAFVHTTKSMASSKAKKPTIWKLRERRNNEGGKRKSPLKNYQITIFRMMCQLMNRAIISGQVYKTQMLERKNTAGSTRVGTMQAK